MSMPGFRAEASLYATSGRYIGSLARGAVAGQVAPQLEAQLGLSTCARVCNCCRSSGNRFCCSHCRFCSGPIGPYWSEPELSL